MSEFRGYPSDMVGELAELAYKYNVSNTMQTNIVVSISIGTSVDVLIIDIKKDDDDAILYRKYVRGDDYAGIAEMLAETRSFVENLYIHAKLLVTQP